MSALISVIATIMNKNNMLFLTTTIMKRFKRTMVMSRIIRRSSTLVVEAAFREKNRPTPTISMIFSKAIICSNRCGLMLPHTKMLKARDLWVVDNRFFTATRFHDDFIPRRAVSASTMSAVNSFCIVNNASR